MNEKEIFEMTKHIDDQYILEASPSPRKNIKLKKRIITFGIAAAITASLSVGAFAAYKAFNKESVATYYDSSAVEKIEQKGYVSEEVANNKHFDLNLDSVMKDNNCIMAVVSVKGLDETAENYIAQSTQMCCNLVYSDNNEKVNGFAAMFGWQPYEKGKAYPMRLCVPVNTVMGVVDLSRPIRLDFIKDENNTVAVDKDFFKDLSLELKDIKQAKSDKFYSADGKMLDVSEFTIVTNGDWDENAELTADKTIIHYKDGTSEALDQKVNAITNNLTPENKSVTIIDLKTLIDPENIDFMEYLGVKYTRK